uniref:Uncharacterized protein n=1 Tax=Moniliophthora roreri TaxID=221103 RepID=A0A0W0F024_MONRR
MFKVYMHLSSNQSSIFIPLI